jgi:hypothetical protein
VRERERGKRERECVCVGQDLGSTIEDVGLNVYATHQP